MKHDHRFMFCAISFLVLAASAAAEDGPKMKKFLTKPLVIEDQGSFYIGGVPKVTNYATVPAANAPTNARLGASTRLTLTSPVAPRAALQRVFQLQLRPPVRLGHQTTGFDNRLDLRRP